MNRSAEIKFPTFHFKLSQQKSNEATPLVCLQGLWAPVHSPQLIPTGKSKSQQEDTEGLGLLPPTAQGEGQAVPHPQLLTIIWMPAPTAQTRSSLSITSASHILSDCLCSVIANVPAPWVALLVLDDMLSCSHGPQLFLEQVLHLFNVMVSSRGQRTCVVLRVPILSCSFPGQRYQRQNPIHAAGSHLDAKSQNNCHWVTGQLTEIK